MDGLEKEAYPLQVDKNMRNLFSFRFSLNRPTGPIQSISRDDHGMLCVVLPLNAIFFD